MAQLQQSHLMSFTAQQPPKTISGNSQQSNSTVSISNSNGSNLGSSASPSATNAYEKVYKDITGNDYVAPTNTPAMAFADNYAKGYKFVTGKDY